MAVLFKSERFCEAAFLACFVQVHVVSCLVATCRKSTGQVCVRSNTPALFVLKVCVFGYWFVCWSGESMDVSDKSKASLNQQEQSVQTDSV